MKSLASRSKKKISVVQLTQKTMFHYQVTNFFNFCSVILYCCQHVRLTYFYIELQSNKIIYPVVQPNETGETANRQAIANSDNTEIHQLNKRRVECIDNYSASSMSTTSTISQNSATLPTM
jgi:hypothetical protein